MVLLKLNLGQNLKRGPGTWKLNDTFLMDTHYKQEITKIVNKCKIQKGSAVQKWIWFKQEVATYSRKYGKIKNQKTVLAKAELRDKMQKLEDSYDKQDTAQYQLVKQDLEEHFKQEAETATYLNKIQWMHKGEKCNKYFLGLEKKSYAPNGINQLYDGNSTTDDPEKINEILVNFWSKLFTTQITPQENILTQYLKNINKITDDLNQELETNITQMEIERALTSMIRGKSPGEDGLTVAFYQEMWEQIKQLYFEMVTEVWKEEQMPKSMKVGILRLLPKPRKDLLSPASWRPICLQGVDLKIVAKVIAERIKKVVEQVVHDDQIGFRAGKYIGETLQLIMDLIDYTDKQKMPGYIVSLDIEKAFDSVEWTYLDKVLSAMGLGENILKWINILRINSTIKINNNGWTTKQFETTRGLKQGDPLSPYLFLLSIEPLAQVIREEKRIKGIKINDIEFKMSQYADDTTLYCGDEASLDQVKIAMDQFYEISGYKNNIQKTGIIGIGINKNKIGNIKGFNVQKTPITILGLDFETNLTNMRNFNVKGKVSKMKKILANWQYRHLTLYGKIMVAKTLGVSLLTYCMMNLPMPKELLEVMEDIIYEFIWGGKKKAKIKRDTLVGEKKDGGLKSPNLHMQNSVWKIKWVERILEHRKWNAIIRHQLREFGGIEYLINCNFKPAKMSINIREFWLEVLDAFAKINGKSEIESPEEIKTQIINNNQHILIGGKSFYKQKLVDSNIDVMQDWITWNNKIESYERMRGKCPTLSWLEYLQIKSAIPKTWIANLREPRVYTLARPIMLWDKKEIKTQLTKDRFKSPKAINKWTERGINNINWKQQFSMLNYITLETRIKAFQYKLMHNILYVKDKLKMFNKINNDTCSACKNDRETIMHLFIQCPITRQFWLQGINNFHIMYNIPKFQITDSKCIFLQQHQNFATQTKINLLCTWLRYYLYQCSVSSTTPNMQVFTHNVECKVQMLKIIAYRENKIDTHNLIWNIASTLNN